MSKKFVILLSVFVSVVTAAPVHNISTPEHNINRREDIGKYTDDAPSDSWAQLANGDTVYGKASEKMEKFLGIPFAEPPIGNLRLRPPVKFNGSLDNNLFPQYSCSCYSMDLKGDLGDATGIPTSFMDKLSSQGIFGSKYDESKMCESCLTLNVYRPHGVRSGYGLPVIVNIYAGGFESGDTESLDQKMLFESANNMGKPFIMVSMNYRTGAFGFLSGKELTAEGSTNLGLLDQRLALEWVAENIQGFGGHPDNVLITGVSAGSMSCLMHIVMNKGNNTYKGKSLFLSAVMRSGAWPPSSSSTSEPAQQIFDKVLSAAGCNKSGRDKLTCLRSLSTNEFKNAQNTLPSMFSYKSLALSFVPRYDGSEYFPEQPWRMIEKGWSKNIPFVIGDQEDEGTIFALFPSDITRRSEYERYIDNELPSITRVSGLTEQLADLYSASDTFGSPYRSYSPKLYPYQKAVAALLGDIGF